VVLLARALGPQEYAFYGVVISVLVWLEQVGKFAIPTAGARLLAQPETAARAVERATLFLNFALYATIFVGLWLVAPLLASKLSIPDGTFFFRLAALDLPLFGVYTALQAIHQGHHRFLRLGLGGIAYAIAKFIGVWIIIQIGVSVEKALIVNALTTVAGIAFLYSRFSNRGRFPWRKVARPLLVIAGPMAVYSLFLMMHGNLNLWFLQLLRPTETATTGIFIAALNIARVPGFGLVAVAAVILPSIARAAAIEDHELIRRYIHQALRFFLLLFLPAAFALILLSEEIMQLAYGARYSGGGPLLSLLLVAEGLHTVFAILGSVLVALGRVWRAALIACLSAVVSVPFILVLTVRFGASGTALAALIAGAISVGVIVWVIRREYGSLLQGQTVFNTATASCLLALSAWFIAGTLTIKLALVCSAILAYGMVLILRREITSQDIAPFIKRSGYGA